MTWVAAQHRRGAAHLAHVSKFHLARLGGWCGRAECGARFTGYFSHDVRIRHKCPGCLAAQARAERERP